MLKFTSIVSSLIVLLFAVSGTYARTIAKPAEQNEASKKDKQEDKSETDEEGKPVESAVQLDVFQAISLVNSQLRWKDFHGERVKSSRLLLSSKQLKSEVRSEEPAVAQVDFQSITVLLPSKQNNWNLSIASVETESVTDVQGNLKFQENTIAFILNCGTYPTDLS